MELTPEQENFVLEVSDEWNRMMKDKKLNDFLISTDEITIATINGLIEDILTKLVTRPKVQPFEIYHFFICFGIFLSEIGLAKVNKNIIQ